MTVRPIWQTNKRAPTRREVDDVLLAPDGTIIGSVEQFPGGRTFASALNPRTGVPVHGGAFPDVAAARAWAERVAGVRHEDGRP